MVSAARARAQKAGVPFDLSPDDIVIPAVCPVLGIPLRRGADRASAPSLARLVPARGYVRGNVIVVSMRANRLKSDATMDELETIADFYSRYIAPSKTRRRRNPA